MGKRVLVEARDLFFRAKLGAIVRASGGELVQEEGDLAVIELGGDGVEARIATLVAGGVLVLAFGSHVRPEALRAARAAGAVAVPNSEVESTLRALL